MAPSAVRTAISFCRVAARASSRFAMLAQAISSTNTTATSRTSNPGLQIGRDKRVEQAEEMNAPVAHFRILLADAGRDRIHLRLRLLRRDPGLELAEDDDHVVQAEFVGGIDGQRRVDVAAADQLQAGGRDADDRCGHAIERNGAADEAGSAAKRRFHNPSPIIATAAPPGFSSSRGNSRPASILVPST